MITEVWPDPDAVARRASAFIAQEAVASVRERGRFLLATSGGSTPWRMLANLAELPVPWAAVELFQVDERVLPSGHEGRNLTQLRRALLDHVPLRAQQVHPMPVEAAELDAGAAVYAATIREVAGDAPALDLVQLGLGADGHTASLLVGCSAAAGTLVAVTGPYQGTRRMTLTEAAISGARRVLWVVTGRDKASALRLLLAQDRSIPAGRIAAARAVAIVDSAAANG